MSDAILTRIYNAYDPLSPADDAQYQDCSEARGGGVFVQDFLKQLSRANKPMCSLFTGHIGSGKSSELAHLDLKLSEGPVHGKKFFREVPVGVRDLR